MDRDQLIAWLVESDEHLRTHHWEDYQEWVETIAMCGFAGYQNMTNEELKSEVEQRIACGEEREE